MRFCYLINSLISLKSKWIYVYDYIAKIDIECVFSTNIKTFFTLKFTYKNIVKRRFVKKKLLLMCR